MLVHKPIGIGHPYRVEPFERTPHFPLAGELMTFRVCSDASTAFVRLYLEAEGQLLTFDLVNHGAASAIDIPLFGKTAKEFVSDSHLADAAARSGEYSRFDEWRITLSLPDFSDLASYWFESSSDTTERFTFSVHRWITPEKSDIRVRGEVPIGRTPTDEEWLTDLSGNRRKVRFGLPLLSDEKVVGFGERFHSVVQNGELVDAVVYEEYKGQGHRTYLPTPFAHIIGGNCGFHLNTTTPTYFDVGRSSKEKIAIEVEVTPSAQFLELNFFQGDPSSVLKQYLDLVGSVPTPPEWIFELWISSNEWNTQERVDREVAESLSSGIFPGVVVLEAWSDESTFTVFRDAVYEVTDGNSGLNASEIVYPVDGAWPNPLQMIEKLHEQNIKIVLWQIPVIKDAGEHGSQAEVNWNYAIDHKKVVLDGNGEPYRVRGFWFQDGLLPDLTDPQVRAWWGEQRRYLVEELGVDGFKTDGGEHAWGDDLVYLDGNVGLVKNNQFPIGYVQTFHELLAKFGKPEVTFSRAGFSGSQKFPTFWAGDENSTWQALRASVTAGITASASGFYFWGWDIGGFSGEIPGEELYLRGAAMATFCPIMQVHSEYNHHQIPSNDRTPWNLAKRHQSPGLLNTFRKFTEIRRALVPYLTTEAAHAVESGRPLMAGLFFDYFSDEKIWEFPYQYLLGRDLLVAPIVEEGQEKLKVYLPNGEWVDLFTKETIFGGQIIEKQVPLDQIAVFVKRSIWADFSEILPI